MKRARAPTKRSKINQAKRSKSIPKRKEGVMRPNIELLMNVPRSKQIWLPNRSVAVRSVRNSKRRSARLKRPARERSNKSRPNTSCSCASLSCSLSKTSTLRIFARCYSATSSSTLLTRSSCLTQTTPAPLTPTSCMKDSNSSTFTQTSTILIAWS